MRAAVALADSDGIAALTMRNLGRELGVEAMSLYRHVANKDDLRVAMVQAIVSEVALPSVDGGWKAGIRRFAISTHDTLIRHRWAAGVMMSGMDTSAPRGRHMEALLRTLRTSGFSPNLTHHAYHALESHMMGFTLWQVNFPFRAADLPRLGAEALRQIPADEFPYTIEHIQQHLAPRDPGETSEFEFGLDLILDGIERMRDAT